MKTKREKLLGIGLIGTAFLLLFFSNHLVTGLGLRPYYGLKVKTSIQNHNFINHQNQRVSLEDFLDKYTYIFFGYTRCASTCPRGMSRLLRISQSIPEANFLFISINPEFDHPDKLNEYIHAYPKNFHALKIENIQEFPSFLKQFNVQYSKSLFEKPEEIHHTGHIFLLDRKTDLRLVYPLGFDDLEKMKQDRNQLDRKI
ncbi:MAG: SCO family protein [Leptospiraceae bacterium]|nr:SCO family protein [Leptospiraceae bacterium]MCP5513113.1 SCO family protein [Leptospiraceae bacterium]